MRFAVFILLLFPLTIGAATNIQHIQTWKNNTNGQVLNAAGLTGSQIGTGTWIYTAESGSEFRYIISDTNFPPYRLPYWVTIGGTNYEQLATDWKWVRAGSNAPSTYDKALYTHTGVNGGSDSNMFVGCFFTTTMNNTGADSNWDLFQMNGQLGGYGIVQLSIRNGYNEIFAHTQGGTQGIAFHFPPDGRVWWLQFGMDLSYAPLAPPSTSNALFQIEMFDATNNWLRMTNLNGEFGQRGTIGSPTNTYQVFLQENYSNGGIVTGTNWFSPLFIWYGGPDLHMPMPETNVIVSDRLLTYRHGTNFGVRGVRPTRTSETLVGSPANDDNGTLINNAIAAAGQGDVILISGTNKITNSISSSGKTNFTFRGTNNAMLLVLGSATVNFGPTELSSSQADVFYPTNGGVVKGATNVTLTTNYSTVNGERMGPGASFRLSQLDGDNTNYHRAMTTSGGERASEQMVYILTTNGVAGRDITFTPPAVQDWTNLPVFVEAYATMRGGIGVENITFTLSNAVAYATNLSTQVVYAHGLIDSWFTGCTFEYFNNYGIHLSGCMFSEVNSNTVHNSLTGGTSHGGVLITGINSSYVYDNIIYNMSPGIHSFGSDVGNVFIGNYFTNTDGRAVLLHHTGHNWNIWEQNVTEGASNGGDGSFITGDGYFGHNWMDTFYRNSVGGFSWKRIQSYMNAVGNHLADTGLDMRYDMYSPGGTYELFEMGYPNIGDLGTNGISPPTAWNFPGTKAGSYSNCFVVITNASIQVVNATNVLGVFSNWPPSSVGYTVIFQDGVNSNKYWNLGQFNPTVAQQLNTSIGWMANPTETGINLVPSPVGTPMMTISNGWTMLIAGPTMYQQRQQIDVPSHLRQWNHIITNGVETVVTDPSYLPKYFPPSLVFSDMPSWWKTNGVACRWPAIDPAQSTEVTPIPAKGRFNAAADALAPANIPRIGRLRGLKLK